MDHFVGRFYYQRGIGLCCKCLLGYLIRVCFHSFTIISIAAEFSNCTNFMKQYFYFSIISRLNLCLKYYFCWIFKKFSFISFDFKSRLTNLKSNSHYFNFVKQALLIHPRCCLFAKITINLLILSNYVIVLNYFDFSCIVFLKKECYKCFSYFS